MNWLLIWKLHSHSHLHLHLTYNQFESNPIGSNWNIPCKCECKCKNKNKQREPQILIIHSPVIIYTCSIYLEWVLKSQYWPHRHCLSKWLLKFELIKKFVAFAFECIIHWIEFDRVELWSLLIQCIATPTLAFITSQIVLIFIDKVG